MTAGLARYAELGALLSAFPPAEGFLEFRGRHPVHHRVKRLFARPDDLGTVLPWLARRGGFTDVFLGIALRDGRGGSKANLVSLPALWVDLDQSRLELPEDVPGPTAIVSSGRGHHLYWGAGDRDRPRRGPPPVCRRGAARPRPPPGRRRRVRGGGTPAARARHAERQVPASGARAPHPSRLRPPAAVRQIRRLRRRGRVQDVTARIVARRSPPAPPAADRRGCAPLCRLRLPPLGARAPGRRERAPLACGADQPRSVPGRPHRRACAVRAIPSFQSV